MGGFLGFRVANSAVSFERVLKISTQCAEARVSSSERARKLRVSVESHRCRKGKRIEGAAWLQQFRRCLLGEHCCNFLLERARGESGVVFGEVQFRGSFRKVVPTCWRACCSQFALTSGSNERRIGTPAITTGIPCSEVCRD